MEIIAVNHYSSVLASPITHIITVQKLKQEVKKIIIIFLSVRCKRIKFKNMTPLI